MEELLTLIDLYILLNRGVLLGHQILLYRHSVVIPDQSRLLRYMYHWYRMPACDEILRVKP